MRVFGGVVKVDGQASCATRSPEAQGHPRDAWRGWMSPVYHQVIKGGRALGAAARWGLPGRQGFWHSMDVASL